jgi:hypothetical protein
MDILGMTINDILILSVIILIIIDIFFNSDIPTQIAYVVLSFTIVKLIDMPILYQILFGVLIWIVLVVFHYLIWRQVIEKINDKFIAPSKHKGGIDGFVGQEGVIREIEGEKFIYITDELHQFKTDKKIEVGKKYIILNTKSNKLII